MDAHLKAGFAACAMALAALIYFAACAANAAPYVLRFQNPNQVPLTQLRTPWGIVAAPCAGGATCSVTIDVPVGRQTVSVSATDGARWSSTSNALAALVRPPAVDCLALAACRFDANGDGVVSGADFAAFVAAFNSAWAP